METFGKRLKELRKQQKLSLMALGKIIGVSDVTIGRWENGKTDIVSQHLVKLSKYFGVSITFLLGIED